MGPRQYERRERPKQGSELMPFPFPGYPRRSGGVESLFERSCPPRPNRARQVKSPKPSLFVTFRLIEDPLKGHNSLEPCGETHKTPVGGLMPPITLLRAKRPMK